MDVLLDSCSWLDNRCTLQLTLLIKERVNHFERFLWKSNTFTKRLFRFLVPQPSAFQIETKENRTFRSGQEINWMSKYKCDMANISRQHDCFMFCKLFHESLDEWNNSKIWETSKIFANRSLIGLSLALNYSSIFLWRKLCRKNVYLSKPWTCNFIKKGTLAQVFSREFCEIYKNTVSTEHLRTTASQSKTLGKWFPASQC